MTEENSLVKYFLEKGFIATMTVILVPMFMWMFGSFSEASVQTMSISALGMFLANQVFSSYINKK